MESRLERFVDLMYMVSIQMAYRHAIPGHVITSLFGERFEGFHNMLL